MTRTLDNKQYSFTIGLIKCVKDQLNVALVEKHKPSIKALRDCVVRKDGTITKNINENNMPLIMAYILSCAYTYADHFKSNNHMNLQQLVGLQAHCLEGDQIQFKFRDIPVSTKYENIDLFIKILGAIQYGVKYTKVNDAESSFIQSLYETGWVIPVTYKHKLFLYRFGLTTEGGMVVDNYGEVKDYAS